MSDSTQAVSTGELSNETIKQYFVYVIKCVSTGQYYVGVSNSTNPNYNPLKWMFNQNKYNKTDVPRYVKLSEVVRTFKMSNFKTMVTKHVGTKEECEKVAYKMLMNMGPEKWLNDNVVNPERYKCERCGKSLKVFYKDLHNEKYCAKTLEDEIESLI